MFSVATQTNRSYVVLDFSRFIGRNCKLLSAHGSKTVSRKSYGINAMKSGAQDIYLKLHELIDSMRHDDIVVISNCTAVLSRDLGNWCRRRDVDSRYLAHCKTFAVMLHGENNA